MSTQQIYNNEKYITQDEFITVTNELRNQIELLKNEIKNNNKVDSSYVSTNSYQEQIKNNNKVDSSYVSTSSYQEPRLIKTHNGTNPGFAAFLELKKKIAAKLGIPNSPKAGKVAGAVQREIKEKNAGMDAVEVSKKAFELFESNMEKYKKMAD